MLYVIGVKLGSIFEMVTEMLPDPFGPQSQRGLLVCFGQLGQIVPPCTTQVINKSTSFQRLEQKRPCEEFSHTWMHSTCGAVPSPFDSDWGRERRI